MPKLIKQWKKVSRPFVESLDVEIIVLTLEDRWESEAGRSSRNKGYAEDENRAAKVCSCTNINLYEHTGISAILYHKCFPPSYNDQSDVAFLHEARMID
jgi:hypothetical protein